MNAATGMSSPGSPTHVEFLKLTPGETAGRITIERRPGSEGGTLADVTYAYTALSERGRAFVDGFTADHHASFMEAWEAELNHFLRTGTKLAAAP